MGKLGHSGSEGSADVPAVREHARRGIGGWRVVLLLWRASSSRGPQVPHLHDRDTPDDGRVRPVRGQADTADGHPAPRSPLLPGLPALSPGA
jgi:hypothetical protein